MNKREEGLITLFKKKQLKKRNCDKMSTKNASI